jgi:acetolactate synthase-1/2/3 large subunit
MRITKKEELVEGMKTAIAAEGPVMVDVQVTKEENCYPMIPAGQAARDMVG